MFTRTSTAVWRGTGMEGQGTLSTQSGAFKDQPYSFKARFASEDGKAGTNPEELVASAHAACFSMALSAGLEKAGTPPTSVSTTATVTLDFVGGAPRITKIHLVTRGKVAGIDQAAFAKAAAEAKDGCPISNLFKGNAAIELDARLDG